MNEIKTAIDELNQEFGSIFSLRHDQDHRFKIVEKDCFARVDGTILLYIYIELPQKGWIAYSKATPEECRKHFIRRASTC